MGGMTGGMMGGRSGGRSGVHFVPRLAVRPLLHDNRLGASRQALRRGVAAPPSGSTTPLTGAAPKGRRAAKRAAGTSPSVPQCLLLSLSVSQCLLSVSRCLKSVSKVSLSISRCLSVSLSLVYLFSTVLPVDISPIRIQKLTYELFNFHTFIYSHFHPLTAKRAAGKGPTMVAPCPLLMRVEYPAAVGGTTASDSAMLSAPVRVVVTNGCNDASQVR